MALTFGVLAVTGVLAFAMPYSARVIGLHALLGFLFVALIGLHVLNNLRPLRGYLHGRTIWVVSGITAVLSLAIWRQPAPVRALLGLSANVGPALDRFEMTPEGMVFHYTPAPHYKMRLTIRTGKAFDSANPPRVAIWLENESFYHIKTLHEPKAADRAALLPYWDFKVRGWRKAKQIAEATGTELKAELDALSGATRNSSFDPADYILPADSGNPMPYRLLVEINQPGDADGAQPDQPSIVYQVEIDNASPRTFQLLELVGYPKREADKSGEEKWSLYFVDERFGSALDLIDSALLTIERMEL